MSNLRNDQHSVSLIVSHDSAVFVWLTFLKKREKLVSSNIKCCKSELTFTINKPFEELNYLTKITIA